MCPLRQKTQPPLANHLPTKVATLLGFEFSSIDLYLFGGKAWRFIDTLAGVHHFAVCDRTGGNVWFADADLARLIELGGYGRKLAYFAPANVSKLRRHGGGGDVHWAKKRIPKDIQDIAGRRFSKGAAAPSLSTAVCRVKKDAE
jgi:hypothetical protein